MKHVVVVTMGATDGRGTPHTFLEKDLMGWEEENYDFCGLGYCGIYLLWCTGAGGFYIGFGW